MYTLEDKARRFGQSVADSLLECDPKDWGKVKRKIMDVFCNYEEARNAQSMYQPPPQNLYQSPPQNSFYSLQQPTYTEMVRMQNYQGFSGEETK